MIKVSSENDRMIGFVSPTLRHEMTRNRISMKVPRASRCPEPRILERERYLILGISEFDIIKQTELSGVRTRKGYIKDIPRKSTLFRHDQSVTSHMH